MLEPSPEQIRAWGKSAVELMAEYLGSLRDRRVYPETSSGAIRQFLDSELPLDETRVDELLGTFQDVLLSHSRHNGHPRMFGYVQSPGTPLAAFADLLASVLNANLTAWRSAPAAVEVERLTIDWIRQIIGFPAGAGGLFVSGGSMANLAALATARNSKDADRSAMRLYASPETHPSIAKAAGLLGFSPEQLRPIAVDTAFKIRLDDLVTAIEADRAAGLSPLCVVANAGTVNTGACDPLRAVREIANRFDLWMHTDASYGGFAVLAESARHLFGGMEEADSVALDPHKWLYLPVDCGCVLYREPEKARAVFAHEAEYTRVIGREAEEAFAFWDYGPELSRRFRALKVWMLLKGVGLRALGGAVEENIACARHLESLVRASHDFEMLAPVELSIFCFRHIPEGFTGDLNAFNERLLVALQEDGSSYLSNTTINGQFALRGCVLNYRTTRRDMEILLEDVRRVAGSIISR